MYDIDFRKLVFSLLPFSLRGSVGEFVCVLAGPFKSLHSRFASHTSDPGLMPWLLDYDCGVESMEKMLNDCFDDEDRRIYVEEASETPSRLVYEEAEHSPLMLATVISSHYTWQAEPFVIRVPSDIYDVAGKTDAIRHLVDSLKLYGMKYRIETY